MNSILETRIAILREAESFLGVKYAHQHRSKDAVDCVGLVICVGLQTGLIAAEEADPKWDKFRNYGYIPNPKMMVQFLSELLFRLPNNDYSCGDIIWLRDHGHPRHLVIATGPRSGIHAFRKSGKVELIQLNAHTDVFVRACFRYRGLQELING